MHLCDDAAARDSLPPDLCVDLSQCTLRWKASASGKRKSVLEIKSLLGLELNLHFDQHSSAAGRFLHSPLYILLETYDKKSPNQDTRSFSLPDDGHGEALRSSSLKCGIKIGYFIFVSQQIKQICIDNAWTRVVRTCTCISA